MDPFYSGNIKKQQSNEKKTNLIFENDYNTHEEHLTEHNGESCHILNKKKWKCLQCTYENWPSALKCTICLASKSNNNNVNNQINTKLKPSLNNATRNQTKSNKSVPLNKRTDSNNKKKNNESKVKLRFESSNNMIGNESIGNSECGLNKSWYSSSSNENLNETGNVVKALKSKKKNMANDIYKIGDLLTKSSSEREIIKESLSNNEFPALNQSIETQKWSCRVCTYLNWPKSIKCVQCYTPKEKPASTSEQNNNSSSANQNQLLSTSLTVLKNAPQLSESASRNSPVFNANPAHKGETTHLRDIKDIEIYSKPKMNKLNNTTNLINELLTPTDIRSQCNSPCTVPKHQHSEQVQLETVSVNNHTITQNIVASFEEGSANEVGVAPANEPIAIVSRNNHASFNINNHKTVNTSNKDNLKKWSCSSCTYQNWPKSQHCVMCHVQRVNNTTITNLFPNSTTAIMTSNNNNTKANKNSNLNNQSLSHKNVQLSSNQKVIASNGNNSNKSGYNLLKNLQLQMDRLFLSAFEGVVDADMTHLHRYINAGGDLTRYLTSDEVKILNRPNIFTVGLTLLHLCYQFNRKDFLMKILNKKASMQKKLTKNSSASIDISKKTNNPSSSSRSTSSMNLLNALIKQVNTTKFSPCQSCPSLASNIIDRYFSASLRQRKTQNRDGIGSNYQARSNLDLIGAATNAALCHQNSPTSSLISMNASISMNISPSPSPPPFTFQGGAQGATSLTQNPFVSQCFYINECHTFILPNEIDDFSPRIQHILFDELLDREVQQELEVESRVINWNIDLSNRLNSRLYPLWNRHSGDCLLDSVLQACYGVFDTDNTLRRVMAESLETYASCFKPRWKDHEILMAQSLDYTLDDYQLEQDWNNILALAHQPGSSLEQAHIFALCHIFRRPIIIYSIKYVKSFRGENIGFTHFEGVYLPLIWEPSFCFKSPIALGYTRGHFTALVPHEQSDILTYVSSNSNSNVGAVSQLDNSETNQQTFYLPLANNEGQLLPVHFLNSSELGRERSILRQYLNLDCMIMQGSNCGLIVAKQRVAKCGLLVKQMLDEWLSYYRNMQMKEMGQQIEISPENEHVYHQISRKANIENNGITVTNSNSTKSINPVNDNQEDDDLGDESDDDDDDDDDEYDDDYDDDDDDDDDYDEYNRNNNQGI